MADKVLVTGAAGFIGSNFVSYLLGNTDYQVFGVDAMKYAANPKTVEHLVALGAVINEVDLLDEQGIARAIEQVDVVVHFAAESHNDNSILGPKPFVESNVLGTFNVLEACRKFDTRFHHISTDEVFGDLDLDDPSKFTETTPYNPSSPYSSTKAASDLLVRAWVRTFGLRATISNCSNNFGPYQHVEKFIPRQITNILEGTKPKLYGTGQNVRDWIHVDQHSEAVLRIIELGQIGETYLIGVNGERSNLDVLKQILYLMNRSEDWFDFVSDRPGHDLRYAIDSSKLRSQLGWEPKARSFEEDLAQTIDWYSQNESWWKAAKGSSEASYARTEFGHAS